MPRYTDVIDRMLKKPTMAALREYLGIGGSGDVSGPVSSTDNAIVRFNGTTGGAIQGGTPVVQDDGRISSVTDPTGAQDVATKNYVDTQAPGAGDVVGPASSVDDRIVTFDGVTGKLIQDSGVGIAVVPSSDQKAALVGTNGTPSGANPYVTNSDPRNSDDRDPNAHAASHEDAGADEINVTGLMGILGQAQNPTNHSATHSNGGGDDVIITNLAGFTGIPTDVLLGDATFGPVPGGGSGTVTSVDLTMPSAIFDVAGNPVTTSGTLAVTLDNQNANLVFAGPSTGAAAAPTFRALVAADLPVTAQSWDVIITKSADQVVTNNTTLQDDTELFTPLVADAFYEIQFVLLYSGNNSGGDYKFLFTHPNLGTSVSAGYYMNRNAALTLNFATQQGTALVWPTGTGISLGTDAASANTFMIADMHFFLRTGATTGNLQYQFANNVGGVGVTSTTRAGTTLKLKRLG